MHYDNSGAPLMDEAASAPALSASGTERVASSAGGELNAPVVDSQDLIILPRSTSAKKKARLRTRLC